MAYEHRTGRVNSGDVTLFYRVFGKAGATPILILHGSNYYDSVDWIEVASALATDREVVVPDRRGWGDSTWSPSKDNSLDALLDDMLAVMGVMKWPKAIVMGHSGAGPTIISFAVNFPQMTEKLDPGRQPDEPRGKRAHRQVGRQSALRLRVGRGGDGEAQVLQSAALLVGPQARRAVTGEGREGPHAQARSGRRQPPADRGGRRAAAPTGARDVGGARRWSRCR